MGGYRPRAVETRLSQINDSFAKPDGNLFLPALGWWSGGESSGGARSKQGSVGIF